MKKQILILSTSIFAIAAMSFDIMDNNGKAGATGSPSEPTCATSCHKGNALNAAGGSISISAPTLTGWSYIPGNTYTISVTVEKTGIKLFGFGFEALTAAGANAGSFIMTNTAQTATKSTSIGGKTRTSVVHQLNAGKETTANTHTFTFNWKAPAKGTGDITFYVAGNAADGNNAMSGDFIYTKSQVVTEDNSNTIKENNDSNINISVFPNPVSESINLTYELSNQSKVSAKLMSLNGKEVTTFFSEEQNAGKQNQKLNLETSVSKGIYFLVLNINDKQHIKKVVVQ